MLSEIGSNFWIDPKDLKGQIKKITPYDFDLRGDDFVWLSTCRSAISLAIAEIERKDNNKKVALIPSYTCETVVDSFLKAGYTIKTFSVDRHLNTDADYLLDVVKDTGASVLLLHRYFGFDTLPNISSAILKIKDLGVKVIEDRTQCLYSNILPIDSDYYVASIRKWMGVPDGAFLISCDGAIVNKPRKYDVQLETAKVIASKTKYEYLFCGVGEKENFLNQYGVAEEILDTQNGVYDMAPTSYLMQSNADIESMKKCRRKNYSFLLETLGRIKEIDVLFKDSIADNGIVPLYFPVCLKNRSLLQVHLKNNAIYAPIIWPKPDVLCTLDGSADLLYQDLLALPIDQRYGIDDMYRMVTCINDFFS